MRELVYLPYPIEESFPPTYVKNAVTWNIDPRDCILLVHDMQDYFLAGFAPAFRAALEAHVGAVIDLARDRDIPIVYTMQSAEATPVERGIVADFWGPGMTSRANTASRGGQAITSALAPSDRDLTIRKWRSSAYAGPGALDVTIATTNRTTLLTVGVYTHVGILATAIESYSRDIRCVVVADACADFTQEYHHLGLRLVAETAGMVVGLDELRQSLTLACEVSDAR